MSNIIIDTIDRHVIYECDICTLVTEKYSLVILKNQIHVPIAAKILVEHQGNIKSFLLKQPIIKSDNLGNISVVTTMNWVEAIYNEIFFDSKDKTKQLKRTIRLLENKKDIGLSFNEIFTLNKSKSELGMIKLEKNILDLNKGGGF